MKAYKLFRVRKDNSLGSLFINKKQKLTIGKWLPAEAHLTKGFAFRPGWHCTTKPYAPHLSKKSRIWCEVEIKNYKTIKRPASQGGQWYLANKIKIIKPIYENETTNTQKP